ncbi:MAG: hypothetical protein HW400_387 [Candidatus Levybacteria bacterium]|nr:hypothetical protein [Candidatus Levybacteria bacterium]
MNITPIIFFDMAAAILILALALIVLVFYLAHITKAIHANPNLKNDALQKNADLLEEARTKAVKIIDDANNQALDIINKVTLSTDVASENFKQDLVSVSSAQIKEFEKATSNFTALYSEILQDLKTKNVEAFQNVSKDIEVSTMEEIKNFKESMQKLTTLSQEEVRKKISLNYETSIKEIDDYKKGELEKIDSGIYKLLEKISKLVLGKALSLSEHENLIEKSLEKARNEGIFK